MIIEALLNIIKNLLNILLIFELPALPEAVNDYISTFADYIGGGVGIVANYVPYEYLLSLFMLLLAVDAGIVIYKFVMWILKKIPMVNFK